MELENRTASSLQIRSWCAPKQRTWQDLAHYNPSNSDPFLVCTQATNLGSKVIMPLGFKTPVPFVALIEQTLFPCLGFEPRVGWMLWCILTSLLIVFETWNCNLYIRPSSNVYFFVFHVRDTLLHYNRVIQGNMGKVIWGREQKFRLINISHELISKRR